MIENNDTSEGNLREEFRNLGKNLVDAIRAAAESPGWQKLSSDIEGGLSEFGTTVKQEYETLKDSPTAQQVKSDINDFQDRIKTGEVETKVREELITALKAVNSELRKVSEKFTSPEKSPTDMSENDPGEQDEG
jgi:gas vesicle protein